MMYHLVCMFRVLLIATPDALRISELYVTVSLVDSIVFSEFYLSIIGSVYSYFYYFVLGEGGRVVGELSPPSNN